jgi:hypothetical protein
VPDRPPRFLSDRRSVHLGTPNTSGAEGAEGFSLSSPYKGRRGIGTLTPGSGISLGILVGTGTERWFPILLGSTEQ